MFLRAVRCYERSRSARATSGSVRAVAAVVALCSWAAAAQGGGSIIYPDSDHDIWVTTPDGAAITTDGATQKYRSPSESDNGTVVAANGSAWVGSVAVVAVLGLLFPLIGVGLLVGGFVLRSRQRRLAAASVATTGRVVGLEERSGNRAMLSHPIVEFDGPEGVVRFVSPLGSRPALHREGKIVKVLYDPSNPQEASLDTALDRWFGPGLMWGMGCAFLALAALLVAAGVLVLLMAR